MITPFSPSLPYWAAAAGPLITSTDSMSAGRSVLNVAASVRTPSTKNTGVDAAKALSFELQPRCVGRSANAPAAPRNCETCGLPVRLFLRGDIDS